MTDPIQIPDFIAVTLGFAVFLIGANINARVEILRRFNIPEPVTGGLLAALAVLAVYVTTGREINFILESRDYFLVMFFAAIGLNARLSDLIAGGKPLAILLVLTLLTILAQTAIGAAGAVMFGYPAKAGVLFGSAALIGGHGTAIAWAPQVGTATGLAGANELGVAVATLGLVLAALIGGPIAKRLIEKNNLTPDRPEQGNTVGLPETSGPVRGDINHLSVMRVLLHLNVAVVLGYVAHGLIADAGLMLPLFVPCLIVAICLANLRSWLFPRARPVARTPALALVLKYTGEDPHPLNSYEVLVSLGDGEPQHRSPPLVAHP